MDGHTQIFKIIMKNTNLNNLLIFNFAKGQIRGFSKSSKKLVPPRAVTSPSTPLFDEHTDDTYRFLHLTLIRDYDAIAELENSIDFHKGLIDVLKNDTEDNAIQIARSLKSVTEDIEVKTEYEESATILETIIHGDTPPINYTAGWESLLDDLNNTQEPGLDSLKNYVSTMYVASGGEPLIENAVEETHNDISPAAESLDNSQYEDSLEHENIESFSEPEDFHSTDSNHEELPTGSEELLSESQSYSDSDNNNNERSTQGDNNSGSNPEDETIKDSSSKDKTLTDDAEDISDCLRLLYDDPVEKDKSTIDFVLQKQQEEMPDIVDSDGGD
jgi:hypothetical protein